MTLARTLQIRGSLGERCTCRHLLHYAFHQLYLHRVRNQLLFPPELETSERTSRVIPERGEKTADRPGPAIRGWTGDPLLGYDDANNLTARVPAMMDRDGVRNNIYVGKSVLPQKAIIHANTRLSQSTLNDFDTFTSPLERPHTPSAYSETSSEMRESGNYRTLEASVLFPSLYFHAYFRSSIDSFLLQMTPLIRAGEEDGAVEVIVTWGEISGVPMVLDPSPSPLPPDSSSASYFIDRSGSQPDSHTTQGFEIRPITRREEIGREMTASTERRKNKSGNKRMVSNRSSGSNRSKEMTPAALALAQRLTGTPLLRSGHSSSSHTSSTRGNVTISKTPLRSSANSTPFGGSLHASYTLKKS